MFISILFTIRYYNYYVFTKNIFLIMSLANIIFWSGKIIFKIVLLVPEISPYKQAYKLLIILTKN